MGSFKSFPTASSLCQLSSFNGSWPYVVTNLNLARGIEKPCVGLSSIAVSDAHEEDSPYFAGWKACDEDPYDAVNNPSGVMQMGLNENQVLFDLLEEYLEQHPEASAWGSGISSFTDNALFQDYHGLESFGRAMASSMKQIRGRSQF